MRFYEAEKQLQDHKHYLNSEIPKLNRFIWLLPLLHLKPLNSYFIIFPLLVKLQLFKLGATVSIIKTGHICCVCIYMGGWGNAAFCRPCWRSKVTVVPWKEEKQPSISFHNSCFHSAVCNGFLIDRWSSCKLIPETAACRSTLHIFSESGRAVWPAVSGQTGSSAVDELTSVKAEKTRKANRAVENGWQLNKGERRKQAACGVRAHII